MTKKRFFYLAMLLGVVAISGCANTDIAADAFLQKQAEDSAASTELAPEKVIIEASQDIHEALMAQLQLYVPLHIEAAQKKLQQAQRGLQQGEPILRVLESAYKARQLVADAEKIKPLVQTALAEAYHGRNALLVLEVQNDLPDQYRGLMKTLRRLAADVEGGFVERANAAQPALLAEMKQLQIDALKKRHLTDVKALLKQADGLSADRYAPQTYQIAQSAYLEAVSVIEQLPFAEGTVDEALADSDEELEDSAASVLDSRVIEAAAVARKAALRACIIGRESSTLNALDTREAERQAIYYSSLLERIGQALGETELKGQSFHEQVENLLVVLNKGPSVTTIKTQAAQSRAGEPSQTRMKGNAEPENDSSQTGATVHAAPQGNPLAQ